MSGDESEFTGLWYPTFVVDKNQMFITAEYYVTSANLTKTTITIVISETLYFIQNHQSPITRQSEVIFHNLLFTIVCLEIFGLIFLIFKLALIPLLNIIMKCFNRKNRIELTRNHNILQEHEAQ